MNLLKAALFALCLLLSGLHIATAQNPDRPPTIWEFVNRRGYPTNLGPPPSIPSSQTTLSTSTSPGRKLLRAKPKPKPGIAGGPATPLAPPPSPSPQTSAMISSPPPEQTNPLSAPSPSLAPSPILSTENLPLASSQLSQSPDEHHRALREAGSEKKWAWPLNLLHGLFSVLQTPVQEIRAETDNHASNVAMVSEILGMTKLSSGGSSKLAFFADAVVQPAQPFPVATTAVAPTPLPFWGPKIKAPYPTNKFFQNFVLDQGAPNTKHTYGGFPEMVHPYLVRSEVLSNLKGVSISYPTRIPSPTSIQMQFTRDLTATCTEGLPSHQLTSYTDLGAMLKWGAQLTAPLVRGSPYITLVFGPNCTPMFSSDHAILTSTPNQNNTKYVLTLNSLQTYAIYSSAPISLVKSGDSYLTASAPFQGVLRIALLRSQSYPGTAGDEQTLDTFAGCYPTGGTAEVSAPGQMVYKFKTVSWDGRNKLLMLSLPLHRTIMVYPPAANRGGLPYRAMEGGMQGVKGNTWLLRSKPPTITWYSKQPVAEAGKAEVIKALLADIAGLIDITTASTYFGGKAMARVARLALIAEQLDVPSAKTAALNLLRNTLTKWLDGTFPGNSFFYDSVWGGIITADSLRGPLNEFGLGMYNDHHFQYGYFVYSGAVLAKMDPEWALKYKPHLFTLVRDYMNPVADSLFPRLRNFDTWLLHSWASGLFPFVDGRNQESSSEAVNAYYAAVLLGQVYGDNALVSLAQSLTGFEIISTQSLWHIPANSDIYDPIYVRGNRMAGNVWSAKVDSNLWWAPESNLANRVGIQVIPITPIAEALFSNSYPFVSSLVRWAVAMPDWNNNDIVPDSWRAFIYALQAFYDQPGALELVRNLQSSDDGNSLTNMLYWVYTRK